MSFEQDDQGMPEAGEFHDARPPGTTIAELTLGPAIGQGGEGIVYRARWRGRDVLAKEYRPTSLVSRNVSGPSATVRAARSSWQRDYRRALDRFINLGERLRALPPHQHVVRVHDVIEGLGTAFLVMDEAPGRSLEEMLDRHGVRDPAAAFDLADQLSQALVFLEREGLLHHDIAPDNIIVSGADHWSIVLIDFNAAKDLAAQVTHSVAGLVKSGYSPIEQYSGAGDSAGVASDLYSAGAVLYRAIAGHPPADAGRRSYRDDHVTLGACAPAGFDAAFLVAIDHALQYRPEDRPVDAAAWRAELGFVYRRPPPPPAPSSPPVPPPRQQAAAPDHVVCDPIAEERIPLRRFQFPVGIVIIFAAVLLALAWAISVAPEVIAVERLDKRAQVALAQGDLPEAQRLFDEVLRRDPDNRDATMGMMITLFQRGDAKSHAEAVTRVRETALTDDERKQIDPFLTSQDRLSLTQADRYGSMSDNQAAATQAAGQVTLTAKDDVWLRVYDADGTTLFERTLRPGEHFDVPVAAQNPMINIGRPDKLQVAINGNAVAGLGTGKVAIKDVPISAAALLARGKPAAGEPADGAQAGSTGAAATGINDKYGVFPDPSASPADRADAR